MEKFKTFCKKLFDRTFWKFILVGVVNTLFGTAIMFVFYNVLHLSYWISSASNYVFGSILSYFLNKYFTFQNKSKSWRTVGKFAVNIAACYLVAYGLAKPAVRLLMRGCTQKLTDNVAMAVGMCLFVALNYLSQRFLTFREKPEETRGENPEENP
jgi:putative flippase GtrA